MKYLKANIYHLIALFTIFIIQFSILNSQDTWIRTYQPFGNDEHYEVEDIRICPDGGYAVIGSIWNEWEGNRGFMMKTDSEGNLLWANIDIAGIPYTGFIVLEDGSFITAGSHYLQKRSPEGGIEWTQPLEYDFVVEAIELTNDGNLITTGSSMDDTINLQKFDLNGNLIWRGTYLPDEYEFGGGYSVTQTSDNGFALTGSVYGENNRDILVIKTDENGDSLWTWTYDGYGSADKGNCIINTFNDEILVCGRLRTTPYNDDGFLGKFDLLGNCLMNYHYEPWSFQSCLQDTDNNYILYSGYSLLKTNDSGDTLWYNSGEGTTVLGDRSFLKDNDFFVYINTIDYSSFIQITKTDSVGQVTAVEDIELIISSKNYLICYPNPSKSIINFFIKDVNPVDVQIDIYNVRGQLIDTISGNDRIRSWNAQRYRSGIYFSKLSNKRTGKMQVVKKITILK